MERKTNYKIRNRTLAIGQTETGQPFILPLDTITQTFAVLAKRRVGKTYTSSVMAEEMVKANLPFVVLDPTGAWWGLRASADGKAEGLPVVIIGGSHGDLPLEPTAGKVIAELVVDHPGWYVIDLSLTESNAAQDRFATDFAERLYRYKEGRRDPLHLFIDEADSFVPQRPFKGQERMLGAFEALVRRGGIRGIGVTLISQRAAVINKNVLSQTEAMIVLQTTGPQDRAAIEDWIKSHVSNEQKQVLIGSLASLQQGEAWFWSPAWLEKFERIKVRQRETFNSSATPKVGQRRIEPQQLAPVDLEQLRGQIAATIEKVKADDPASLRKRIQELEKELRARPKAEPEKVIEQVEVPVIREEQINQLQAMVGNLAGTVGDLVELGQRLGEMIQDIQAGLNQVDKFQMRKLSTRPAPTQKPESRPIPVKQPEPLPVAPPTNGSIYLRAGAVRMLRTLAPHPEGLTRIQLATLAGHKGAKGGTFNTYLSDLRTNGLIEESTGKIRITSAGLACLGSDIPAGPQTTEEILAIWRPALRLGENKMLDILIENYPESVNRQELASLAGYEASGGTFNTYLSVLRRNNLIQVDGQKIWASGTLFLN